MKKIILLLSLLLYILSCTSCMTALADKEPELTASADSALVPLDDFQKQIIRERYMTQSIELEEYSELYHYDSFFEKNRIESWCDYTPTEEQMCEYTLDELLSIITPGLSAREVCELLGSPPPSINHCPSTNEEKRTVRYYSSDGQMLALLFSHGGLGTEESPFRWVVSSVAYKNYPGGAVTYDNRLDSLEDKIELGILPTFLAVELHGTEYLISEGLLSEEEAVFYAEEQAVYLASQSEQESLPDAEIPETAPEAVVQ